MTGKHSNHFYNKNLQPYANRLRKEMIPIPACRQAGLSGQKLVYACLPAAYPYPNLMKGFKGD